LRSCESPLGDDLLAQTKSEFEAEEDTIGPALNFMGTLWALKHALEVTSKRMESELGITAAQRMTVRIVGRYPGISASRVAKLLRVHRATVTVTVNRLERRQIIRRGSDPLDQRRVRLTLTKEGQALDVPATGTVESAVTHLIAHASPSDLAVTQRSLLALIAALEAAR